MAAPMLGAKSSSQALTAPRLNCHAICQRLPGTILTTSGSSLLSSRTGAETSASACIAAASAATSPARLSSCLRFARHDDASDKALLSTGTRSCSKVEASSFSFCNGGRERAADCAATDTAETGTRARRRAFVADLFDTARGNAVRFDLPGVLRLRSSSTPSTDAAARATAPATIFFVLPDNFSCDDATDAEDAEDTGTTVDSGGGCTIGSCRRLS